MLPATILASHSQVQVLSQQIVAPPTNDIQQYCGVFCLSFSSHEKKIAVGFGDCSIKLIDAENGRQQANLRLIDGETLPVTNVKFKPQHSSILAASGSNGCLRIWETNEKKCLQNIRQPGNEINCLDYNLSGKFLVTGGSDTNLRVYDATTLTLHSTHKGGQIAVGSAMGTSHCGHTSRIFCVKSSPVDENVFISGGWDKSLKLWDLRQPVPFASIEGPKVCGSSIDISSEYILAGSWSPTDSVQIFDLKTRKNISSHTIIDPVTKNNCSAYCAQFVPGRSDLFAVGGSGTDEALIFDTKTFTVQHKISGFQKPVTCLNFNGDGSILAVGSGDDSVRLVNLKYQL